jgi:hypothetical protein
MRPLLALFASLLLLTCLAACGGGTGTSSTSKDPSSTAADQTSTDATARDELMVDADKDNDVGTFNDDRNNSETLPFEYGHPASAADKRAVAAMIEVYYKIAENEEGAKACSMIYLSLAEGVAEDYGHGSAGEHYLSSGRTCPQVMTLLFKHFHAVLTIELPLLKVSKVLLVQHHGLAVLTFGKLPEREISIRKEGPTWKVQQLLDSEVP